MVVYHEMYCSLRLAQNVFSRTLKKLCINASTFSGMNECSVHNFIGRCSEETLQSIFPRCEERFITAEELKQCVVFEESTGHEDVIQHFFMYLLELEKYEPGEWQNISSLKQFETGLI